MLERLTAGRGGCAQVLARADGTIGLVSTRPVGLRVRLSPRAAGAVMVSLMLAEPARDSDRLDGAAAVRVTIAEGARVRLPDLAGVAVTLTGDAVLAEAGWQRDRLRVGGR